MAGSDHVQADGRQRHPRCVWSARCGHCGRGSHEEAARGEGCQAPGARADPIDPVLSNGRYALRTRGRPHRRLRLHPRSHRVPSPCDADQGVGPQNGRAGPPATAGEGRRARPHHHAGVWGRQWAWVWQWAWAWEWVSSASSALPDSGAAGKSRRAPDARVSGASRVKCMVGLCDNAQAPVAAARSSIAAAQHGDHRRFRAADDRQHAVEPRNPPHQGTISQKPVHVGFIQFLY